MSKYEPLARHLAGLAVNEWTATFSKIEQILGFRLPKSARQYKTLGGQTKRPPVTRRT